jgi:hypothetical protein
MREWRFNGKTQWQFEDKTLVSYLENNENRFVEISGGEIGETTIRFQTDEELQAYIEKLREGHSPEKLGGIDIYGDEIGKARTHFCEQEFEYKGRIKAPADATKGELKCYIHRYAFDNWTADMVVVTKKPEGLNGMEVHEIYNDDNGHFYCKDGKETFYEQIPQHVLEGLEEITMKSLLEKGVKKEAVAER